MSEDGPRKERCRMTPYSPATWPQAVVPATAERLLLRAAELLDDAERLSESASADRYMTAEVAMLRVARSQAAATLAQAYAALATATADTGASLRSLPLPRPAASS
jgi:hypothetical protein